MNKIANLQTATSGFSLGKTVPFDRTKHRIALYEELAGNANTAIVAGSCMYGIGLWGNGSGQVGCGIYGGTNALLPNQGKLASGQGPHLLVLNTRYSYIRGSGAGLNVAGNGVFSGTCTATSFLTSSDKSIKDGI